MRYGVIGLIALSAMGGATAGQSPQQLHRQRQWNFGQPGGQPASEGMGPKLSVSFPGGELERYIATLQAAAGDEPINVITPAEAKRVVLPPITLRNVTLYTALSAISSAFEENSEHYFNISPVGGEADVTFAVKYARADRSSTPARARADADQLKRMQVYSVRDLIDPPGGAGSAKVKYEDIIAAIEGAMQMIEPDNMPRLMFHRETGLLMVSGTMEQTSVVNTLISRIRDDMQQRWNEEENRRHASTVQAQRMARAKSEIQIAELELSQAMQAYERTAARVNEGLEGQGALSPARTEMEKARAKLDRIRLEMDLEQPSLGEQMTQVVYDLTPAIAKDPRFIESFAQKIRLLGASVTNASETSVEVKGNEEQHGSLRMMIESYSKRE